MSDSLEKEFVTAGKLVALRPITDGDTELVVSWRNNDRVRNNFIYREHFTNEIHTNWLRTKVDTGEVVQLIICEAKNNFRPVGSVYFRYLDDTRTEAEYGIFIGEDDATGKGYGNETAALATDYARDELGIKRLILRVFTSNIAARKSYEYGGFVKCQDLPMVECSDGEKSDMILMERIL
ncbi:GNAT family N-acetyltransferase [Butyrivibrio sp. MC2021]|uniref:GNAT family N-acetyltransferase n=1 Tax=Butyrivibrio sp. MC2021 TaxID=1408306 RepID=UPI00047DA014|nr:GNAT family N-acetyltransferase [Butyrivibrio sp. MC2021]